MLELPPLESLQILTEKPGQIYLASDDVAYISGSPGQVFQLTSELDLRELTADEIRELLAEEQSN